MVKSELKDKLFYPLIILFIILFGASIGGYYTETKLKNDLIKFSEVNIYGRHQTFRFDDSDNYYEIYHYSIKNYSAIIIDDKGNHINVSGKVFPNNPVTEKQIGLQNNVNVVKILNLSVEH